VEIKSSYFFCESISCGTFGNTEVRFLDFGVERNDVSDLDESLKGCAVLLRIACDELHVCCEYIFVLEKATTDSLG
jgi:hypothetical protein